jgi:D-erythro-7,8-dihydroneopterin triphosphate epimerase
MAERPLDAIYIRDLTARCIVGINPDERVKPQEVVINITLYADLAAACTSDRIEDTVDYKGVKQQVLEMVERSSYCLLERLAEEIAGICLKAPKVVASRVMVDKPAALRFARSVALEIYRERSP